MPITRAIQLTLTFSLCGLMAFVPVNQPSLPQEAAQPAEQMNPRRSIPEVEIQIPRSLPAGAPVPIRIRSWRPTEFQGQVAIAFSVDGTTPLVAWRTLYDYDHVADWFDRHARQQTIATIPGSESWIGIHTVYIAYFVLGDEAVDTDSQGLVPIKAISDRLSEWRERVVDVKRAPAVVQEVNPDIAEKIENTIANAQLVVLHHEFHNGGVLMAYLRDFDCDLMEKYAGPARLEIYAQQDSGPTDVQCVGYAMIEPQVSGEMYWGPQWMIYTPCANELTKYLEEGRAQVFLRCDGAVSFWKPGKQGQWIGAEQIRNVRLTRR